MAETKGSKCCQGGVGNVDVKKIAVLVGTALVLFFLISAPDQSAQMVKDILSGLRDAAEAIITFVKQLVV